MISGSIRQDVQDDEDSYGIVDDLNEDVAQQAGTENLINFELELDL